MRREFLPASVVVALMLFSGSTHSARAAQGLGIVPPFDMEAEHVQKTYWAVDPYGRRYWVPVYRRRFYGPPPIYYHPYRHGWRDRWGRWHY